MFYRKHALTYHRPHLYGSLMILWWGYALQETCPYIPPTTSLWQSNDPMMRLCFTGSMPLHTTGHISMAALWSYDEAMFYRKHTLTYHQPRLYDSPMMRLCFTGSMPLHTTNHVFMTVSWSYDEAMFYRKHALTYHYLTSMTVLWSNDETMFYRKQTLTYHQPRLYDSLMILWWGYVLQEACPYIPLPHLYDSLMILWWDYVLQEACPYIPPTTSLC